MNKKRPAPWLAVSLVIALSSLAVANSQQPKPPLSEELKMAVMENCYRMAGKGGCAKFDDVDVRIEKTFGDFAKVTVRRESQSGESDTAYLKREGGRWVMLDEGTGIDPSAINVPREVW